MFQKKLKILIGGMVAMLMIISVNQQVYADSYNVVSTTESGGTAGHVDTPHKVHVPKPQHRVSTASHLPQTGETIGAT
ncbi:hypothetical protein LOSG293_500060 [Secundilactobacillus oryzae JCM 18671]|uniref:Uncharacterized protein n=2 Tax=Secundilactobacillus oryzae TaxID=1202668 RepID=A0A081BKY4_9LACO|nr:hypothetical protein LOSG293_500060 [Secundilactobacillus oryzae JCM 18671]